MQPIDGLVEYILRLHYLAWTNMKLCSQVSANWTSLNALDLYAVHAWYYQYYFWIAKKKKIRLCMDCNVAEV